MKLNRRQLQNLILREMSSGDDITADFDPKRMGHESYSDFQDHMFASQYSDSEYDKLFDRLEASLTEALTDALVGGMPIKEIAKLIAHSLELAHMSTSGSEADYTVEITPVPVRNYRR